MICPSAVCPQICFLSSSELIPQLLLSWCGMEVITKVVYTICLYNSDYQRSLWPASRFLGLMGGEGGSWKGKYCRHFLLLKRTMEERAVIHGLMRYTWGCRIIKKAKFEISMRRKSLFVRLFVCHINKAVRLQIQWAFSCNIVLKLFQYSLVWETLN